MRCIFRRRTLPVAGQSEGNVNENLIINSAVLKATQIVSGKYAALTVKATVQAAVCTVTDSSGGIVEFKNYSRLPSDDIVTFRATWTVTGHRGDVLGFTIICYDENGRRSANTKTVEVTIK